MQHPTPHTEATTGHALAPCTIAVAFHTSDILLIDAQDGALRTLQQAVPGVVGLSPTNPVWSADGATLLVHDNAAPTHLYAITLATGDVRLLADDAHRLDRPSLAPDGDTVAYVTDFLGASTRPSNELVLQHLTTGERQTLAPFDAYFSFPQWSPDGTQLTFNAQHPDEREALYIMSADGSDVRLLLDGRAGATWSPQGDALAVVRADGLYLLAADSDAPTPLVGGRVGLPSWSPDGARLVAVRYTSGQRAQLILVDLAAGTVSALTDDSAMDTHPAWSPGGTAIAFVSNRVSRAYRDVWLVHADGTGARPLTRESGATGRPLWHPACTMA